MGKKIENNRPTSPHLQIYKWNICSLTSILHRLTGVMLFVSLLIISWYIVIFTYNYEIVGGNYDCECIWWKAFEYLTVAAVIGLIFSISFHLCNGIRHLFWDIGMGFELQKAKYTGYMTLVLTFLISGFVLAFLWYYRYM